MFAIVTRLCQAYQSAFLKRLRRRRASYIRTEIPAHGRPWAEIRMSKIVENAI